MAWPERIICMTEETVETLYLLGEEDRIAGISGFTVRPPRARKEKPKVSAFTSAKIPKILDLKPDLVLGFSDLQADIAAELIRQGVEVYILNHRTVAGILQMIRTLGRLVDAAEKADELAKTYEQKIADLKSLAAQKKDKPRVYFEEWYDPIISGIGWVSELIEIAGGVDCYKENAQHQGGKERIVADPLEVVAKQPDIIIGSWCGRRFHPHKVGERDGWSNVPAVRNNQVFEIKSANILQPGPAALSDGLDQLHQIISAWVKT
ncbi:MAG: iron complex transport system substrate-binding protein [Pseudoalteromonas tetraodonis]|jgi:iron complex transport system substrate-binding protein